MDQKTANDLASALRYSSHANRQTVSSHEPELLLKVVEGAEILSTLPRRRDHSGACQIEIDVLQHHNPGCEHAKARNIKNLPAEDIQGSYVLLERLPVATCKNKNLLDTTVPEMLPAKSVLKKPVSPNPVSKFSMHDEHVQLRGSRKGTHLNEPDAFEAGPSTTRSTIENVALLPKLGCSQPSFVARVEQKVTTKNRYDPSADPAAPRNSKPTVVNTVNTNDGKTPFDASDAGKTKSITSRPFQNQSEPCYELSSKNKSKTSVTPVYTTKTDNSMSAFDREPSKHNKQNRDSFTVRSQSSKILQHTCTNTTNYPIVYRDKDGNVMSSDCNPFDTDTKRQSIYAVVSKTSRVSFSEQNPASILQGKNTNPTKGSISKNFDDPCFRDHKNSIVMAAGVRGPVLPTTPPTVVEKPEMATMTSFMACCPPGCDVQIIGKPRENFKEESGSEDELNVESQHTVMTDNVSKVDTVSRSPYYPETAQEPQHAKEGFFKRVFLCGACRKQPATTPAGDTASKQYTTDAVSQANSRSPTCNTMAATGAPSTTGTRRSTTTNNTTTSNKYPPSVTPSNVSHSHSTTTRNSAKSHSKQGHNAEQMSYRSYKKS